MADGGGDDTLQLTSEEYTEQVYKWLCQAYQMQIFSLGEFRRLRLE
jgi:hypothetical protein